MINIECSITPCESSSTHKPRRSIVPYLLELITDLSRNTGACWAGDLALARMLSEKLNRKSPYTDRRIRQGIAELQTTGQITVLRTSTGRHLKPTASEIESISTLWTSQDFRGISSRFPNIELESKEKREKKETQHQPVVVPFSPIEILEILEHSDISDDEFLEIVDRLPGYRTPEAVGLVLPASLFTDTRQKAHSAHQAIAEAQSEPKPTPEPQAIPELVIDPEIERAADRAIEAKRQRGESITDPVRFRAGVVKRLEAASQAERQQATIKTVDTATAHREAQGRAVACHWNSLSDWFKDSYRTEAARRRIPVPELVRERLGLTLPSLL